MIPDNRWLTNFPDLVTAEWIDAQFDALLAQVAEAGDDADAWFSAVRRHNELSSHLSTIASRVGLAFRQATDDEQATAENQRLNRKLRPAWSRRDIEFTRALAASPVFDQIEGEFGSVFAEQIRAELITNDPVNIDLHTELGDLLMQHSAIFGKATVTWRGETLPYSYARKAATDTDTDERRAAHQSVLDFLRNAEPDLQRIYDKALELRLQSAKNLDMSSYIDLRYLEMGRTDWGVEDAAGFRSAIREHVVPVVHELRRQQAKAQGVDLVHPADLEIWPGEQQPELIVDIDGQLEAATRAFAGIGDEFGEPFAMLVREQLIDLPARPGKGNGAFCTSFCDQRVPYLFCNSVGTAEDVKTLVHEYGHGLQQFRSRDIELVSLRWPTLEACEIHSMALELLAHGQMEEFFGDQAETFRQEHLRSTLMIVPYLTAVDDFQHQVYDPERAALPNADERGDIWQQLTDLYRPGIDWGVDPWYHRSRWLQQLHIFHSPFYYLDYALARMVSWQLWLDYLERPEQALDTYLALCDAGGTKPFRTLVREAGLQDPFDAAVVADTMRRLRPHLNLA